MEPWSFTRPDSSASGMFFFQNCVTYAVRHIQYLETRLIQYTYIDCIPHNGRAVLDNKAKVRVTGSKSQRLRTNAASNIDNQRALGKALPGVPCQFNIKSADGL